MTTPDMDKLPYFVRGHRLATISKKGEDGEYKNETVPTDNWQVAEVITSQLTGYFEGDHRPILDIDIPATIIPSSTPGHGHLYINKRMSWRQYEKLLRVLAEVGIIEQGYADASIDRQHTAVRLPWVKKEMALPEPYEEFEL